MSISIENKNLEFKWRNKFPNIEYDRDTPCSFGSKCKGDGTTFNGGWSAFPAIKRKNDNNPIRSCHTCADIVIEARKKYINDNFKIFQETGKNIPREGCAYCGGNSFTVSCKTGLSTHGEYCSTGCQMMCLNQQTGDMPFPNYF